MNSDICNLINNTICAHVEKGLSLDNKTLFVSPSLWVEVIKFFNNSRRGYEATALSRLSFMSPNGDVKLECASTRLELKTDDMFIGNREQFEDMVAARAIEEVFFDIT